MTNAFVLMTALPPTRGHGALIAFAAGVADNVTVIVNTQPSEPYSGERVAAITEFSGGIADWISVRNIHKTIPQDPEGGGFWAMWAGFLIDHGFKPGDYIIASEPYGKRLAEEVDGQFLPFDIERQLVSTRASDVRMDTVENFDQIMPEFMPYIQKTVTFFGAESVGKTTMTNNIADYYGATRIHEYARPYLEFTGPELTERKMQHIFAGQRGLQGLASSQSETPFIFQDTDLFSTVGYWGISKFAGNAKPIPRGWVEDAHFNQSDLYIILGSTIPFEEDPIRYGGDVRESDDQYWIDLCERYGLPYVYVTEVDDERFDRVLAELEKIEPRIDFTREFN